MRVGRSWSVVVLVAAVCWPGPGFRVAYGNAAASWAQDGFGATGSGFNPGEKWLVPARLGRLKRQWTVTATGRQVCASQSAPVMAGGRLFLTGRESIGAYDAATGKPLWTHAYADPMDTVTPRLAVAGDIVVAATGGCQSQSDPNGDLLALDAATGAPRWQEQTEAPDETLTVDRGMVVVGGEDAGSSTTTAFSLATGRKMWEKPLAIPAAGVSAAGVLLLTRNGHESHEQGALAVDITTGRDRWRTGQDWTVRAADPAGAFFLVNDPSGALLKVAAATGEVAWTRPGLSGAVTVDAERAYVAGEKALVALDLSTGGTSWERAGHGPLLRPVVAGGVLYCVTKATRVQALAAATAHPLELPVRASPADHAVVNDGRLYLTDGSHLTAYAAGAVTG